MSIRTPILSFFTGGGFLDIGFEDAGFKIAWTNESDPDVAAMYESAMSGWNGRSNHCSKISSRASICDISAAGILREAFGDSVPDLFGVVGGPPCTDFSMGGVHRGGNGEFGKLTGVFVETICRLRPHFFVIENVPGLCLAQQHRRFLNKQIAYLEGAGQYATDWKVLDALELGVPQNRHRLFVVGFRRSIAKEALGRALLPGEKDWYPWPKAKHPGARDIPWPTTAPFGSRPERPAGIPIELTVWPLLKRTNNPESLPNGDEYFNAYSKKFHQRREGDVAHKSFKRLHRYRYSPTVWYGNNEVHLHPWKPRRLSVRESLRLQTVPDEYILPAEFPLSKKFKLICNGVPCRMALAVAESVKSFLSKGIPK